MTTSELTHATYDRLSINRLGLWFFIASDSMIFIILLVTRFALFGTYRPHELNQQMGFLLTLVLLLSSLTAYRAETSIATGHRKGLLRNLLFTAILGTMFLLGVVALEWPEALHAGIVPQRKFGMVFFSMTGMHAFHVLTGVAMLFLVFLNARRGAYSPEHHWGVEGTVKYWHFVDLVWVFFYSALYLLR